MHETRLVIGLSAVILAVDDDGPWVLCTRSTLAEPAATGLPFGPFDPSRGSGGHRTFELALRDFVTAQTGFAIGYVEQLYTFGDQGREAPLADMGNWTEPGLERIISVGYLALTAGRANLDDASAAWRDWYEFFPWEDRRDGRPSVLPQYVEPKLARWAESAPDLQSKKARQDRARLAFGLDGAPWNEERVLDRYELLYEAGLIAEAARDRARLEGKTAEASVAEESDFALGIPMISDHRRILATAIGRLRAKIKYRPVVFELVPDRFTLFSLQRVVEAIAGTRLHKSNFRRLLLQTGLVQGTGSVVAGTGGRPAELFRFRQEVLRERTVGGVHVPTSREI
jgi:hypothetical protein